MKVKYYIDPKGSHLIFDIEGDTIKEAFRELAEIQEVFEADKCCGRCGCESIQYRVRSIDKNEFFELVCRECQSTLPLGQTKDGERLYPKRKGDHGGWLEAYRGDRQEADREEARAGR